MIDEQNIKYTALKVIREATGLIVFTYTDRISSN